ncbi:Interleukin-17A [Mizuhopecten yessoensis]|uniref:Interleukin-17A n=1 Tax=Mizuhopecten yessoensis TaxID=6573 RepID=A0A210Q898_MIZYE|nr:Interleukin-17A [Mizuhopecten yessoensis]
MTGYFTCEAIRIRVNVLWKTNCDDGKCVREERTITVSVGLTCVQSANEDESERDKKCHRGVKRRKKTFNKRICDCKGKRRRRDRCGKLCKEHNQKNKRCLNCVLQSFPALIGFIMLQAICNYTLGQQVCDSLANPPIFMKQLSDLRNETMAVIDPAYRGLTSEVDVTRTEVPVVPRGAAFLEDRLRAVCPWSYARNEDPHRIPQVIFEAKCDHQTTCFGYLGSHDALPMRRPVCSEMYYYSSVMRRTGCDENGQNQYERVMQKISAGCTALRPAGS